MASSTDELDSYEQTSRANAPKASARSVAGPSKPASKRKKAGAANNVIGDAAGKDEPEDPIAISSDGEDVHPPNSRRANGATGPAKGRTANSNGRGKAVATAKRKKIVDQDQENVVEETAAETEDDRAMSHRGVGKASDIGKGNNHERLKQQLEQLQKQLKEVSEQRDVMSSQLDELFQLRNTDSELQLAEQKAQYEARIKAQEDTIHELHNSLSRVDALSKSGGTTSLHFLTRETADEEKKDVQREVGKLKDTLKNRDMTIANKDAKINELDQTIKQLSADLKTEVENSKFLKSRNAPHSAAKHSTKSGDPKNALAIRLYEELTNLLVTNVRHEPGQYKEDDAIYTCVQTTRKGTSLNFTLKFTKEPEEGQTPSSGKRIRTVDKVIYTPLELEKEPREFVEQLDFLASPFTFQKEQTSVFTKTLMTYLEGPEGSGDDNEDSVDLMEVED